MTNAEQGNADRARRLMAQIRESGVEELAELIADDIEMDLPFAPEGVAATTRGRAAVLEALRYVPRTFEKFRFNVHECYECPSRNVVILECTSIGIFRKPAPAYQNRYVFILEFADGRLRRWREFFDPYPVAWSATLSS